jgi:hypothetical protein
MEKDEVQELLQGRVKELWAGLTAMVALLEHVDADAELPINPSPPDWGEDLDAARDLGRSLVQKAARLTSDLAPMNFVFSVSAGRSGAGGSV